MRGAEGEEGGVGRGGLVPLSHGGRELRYQVGGGKGQVESVGRGQMSVAKIKNPVKDRSLIILDPDDQR